MLPNVGSRGAYHSLIGAVALILALGTSAVTPAAERSVTPDRNRRQAFAGGRDGRIISCGEQRNCHRSQPKPSHRNRFVAETN